jgi:hypothetical protein
MIERISKLIHQKYAYPVTIKEDDKFIFFHDTPMAVKDELKAMRGARWMGYDPMNPEKCWRVDNCRRNRFNLDYMEGKKPFARYTRPLLEAVKELGIILPPKRMDNRGVEHTVYGHQNEMTYHTLVRRQCVISGEMGVGKTLAIFRAIEHSCVPLTWYVAPKSALAAVQLDAKKWRFHSNVLYMTYDEMKKRLTEWKEGTPPPQFVVFDESSRLKNASSQRSQAAYYLAEQMRDAYGDKAYIVLMTGSPAPKSPVDWYWQCEIACPGFLKEGDVKKFENRLAISERQGDFTGISYFKRLAWRDGNPNTCRCGQKKDHPVHDNTKLDGPYHEFNVVENEVGNLYKRMGGLVYVKFKKDCLDLPEKQYRLIKLKPSLDLMRASRLIAAKAPNVITAMTLLRELSDGFQYQDELVADDICLQCMGNCFVVVDGKDTPCIGCSATGSKRKTVRKVVEVPSPKLDALTDLLEENEDYGRLVVYAGFMGSIDRICSHVTRLGWQFIRVDGRGWFNSMNPAWDTVRVQEEFQKLSENPAEKIVFVGHPGSAGMGLTLTAASMIVYVSNDFNGESRIQSEDRIHRPGADENRGCTIVDLVLLPTDQKLLDNLARKRELQSISLGELAQAIDNYQFTVAE